MGVVGESIRLTSLLYKLSLLFTVSRNQSSPNNCHKGTRRATSAMPLKFRGDLGINWVTNSTIFTGNKQISITLPKQLETCEGISDNYTVLDLHWWTSLELNFAHLWLSTQLSGINYTGGQLFYTADLHVFGSLVTSATLIPIRENIRINKRYNIPE